jgi:hypothetical protein
MMKNFKLRYNKIGISLVEILIAISIAAFAFLPIIKIFTSSTRNSQQIANYAIARELTAKSMDEILSLDFDNLKNGTTINLPALGVVFPKIEKKGKVTFKISINVAGKNPTFHVRHRNLSGFISPPIAIPGSVNDLKKIDVKVSWDGISNVQQYKLQALKADLYR